MWDDGRMNFDVHIEVRRRAGVADPEGSTIERSLPALGFDGVRGVHVGKSIRFSLEAADEDSARREVEDMCARFLSNPVIEDVDIHLGAAQPA
jgi:phosphoribosylformylglycinamidine synthase subunit PurS